MCPVFSPAPSPFGRGGRLLGLLLVSVMLAGCRVDATVEVQVDGAGGEVAARVKLDPEAVSVLGGSVVEGAQVTDLVEAGWTITPARRAEDGVVVKARKRFSHPDDLAAVLEELSGRAGPLARFRLERTRSLTRVGYRLRGVVDLTDPGATTGFANAPGLAGRLEDAGVDPERVARLLSDRAAEGFGLRVVVALPGREPARFEAAPGERVEVRVGSSVPERVRPALLALAGILGVAAVVVFRRPA